MTNKRKRWKIAQELRKYGIDFDVSHKMARFLLKGSLYYFEALEAGEFRGAPNMVTVCGRGCCFEQRGYVYHAQNKKGKWIELTQDDLNSIAKR